MIRPPVVPSGQFGNYELLEEIGRGAMGVVYRARERRLNRAVAVKMLQDRYSATSLAAVRFVDEAKITGQLQHPGIPPVHEVGELPERPAVPRDEAHQGAHARGRSSRATSMSRGSLIAVFEQICQAVAYAHDHGVIHRDLKPANVMVGAFGEVQVMDWGLAKFRNDTRTDTAEDCGSRHVPRSAHRRGRGPAHANRLGPRHAGVHVAGAGRRGSRSDRRAQRRVRPRRHPLRHPDGRAAVRGTDSRIHPTTRGRRRNWTRPSPGSMRCGAEPELVALCKRCLSRRTRRPPAKRRRGGLRRPRVPGRGRGAARQAELERVRAEGERAKAELQAAEQRKRRKVQLALLAAVMLLVTGGGAVAWWQDRLATAQRIEEARLASEQTARETHNRDTFLPALERCENALREGDAYIAAIALSEAEPRLREGGTEGFGPRVERCRKDLAMLQELDRIDIDQWTVGGGSSERSAVVAGWNQAFARFGIIPSATPATEAARQVNNSLIRERLLEVLDLWMVNDPFTSLADILNVADPDDYRTAVRAAARAGTRFAVFALAAHDKALEQPPRFVVTLSLCLSVPAERRRAILTKTLVRKPRDLVVLMAMV